MTNRDSTYDDRLSELEAKRRRSLSGADARRADESDREYVLGRLAEAEDRLRAQFDERVRVAVAEALTRARSEHPKHPTLIGQLPAIIIAVTGLVAALAAVLKPEPDTKAAEGYAAVREELVVQRTALQQNTQNDEWRWNWVAGFAKRVPGMKVVDQPGSEPIEPLEVAPAPRIDPRTKKTASGAPAVQIREPLPPPPAASVPPVKLPAELSALPPLPKK